MTLPLDGLSAIVTGAGRGLGRAEALELARLGATVVVNDYGQPGRDGSGRSSAAPADEVAEEIRTAGGQAVAHHGDIADFAGARELVALAVERFGKLDVLVNNAGILRDRMVFSMTEDEWDSVIRVHLKGHFNTVRFASAHWRERAKAAGGPVYGRIVNTSSEAFLAGSAGQPNYAAAKGGIVGLTTSTAAALARYGVTANAICPRARTRMTEDVFAGYQEPAEGELDPLAPEHVAPLVGYLAAPAAAGVTGQVFVVHGGLVAVLERPRVAARFDTEKECFSHDELDALLTPHFAARPAKETFAATEVLGLRRE
ncbi:MULTISPECIES: 3-oxoacyl-ACP reductase [Streptomyces]|uniref:3-oxoacyl-ACP reductase n=1 Tax=Streptomyces tsukubensis (strain DSM 42081 / NBRC 108919 / NRRL 18488 / 9993) TaxID=1114943 RepID=I2MXJ4_STRT9|nr:MULTISPECIES: 3-oxoacyl-ACP reductase [Streptomyces]AZK93863.1 3-oxoacyl-ACP reductase [Streptomyces tsukubensis]EIF89491.1 3-ketoacyl-(acyl-carrier-protein) reductase [Streptomyces tsukubensis NRRL18488]MYS65274.1 3-oxoacyl-ACP reductase [Streptomyces sp. SID5473]QKM70006.1 3-oxoacyl-ACP reductase [Streptomyces tsukubensis NRRL18488]TAI46015.1 3-oxoacyl-ACP reductase [Streptomyces tsukubensis]